MIKNTKIDLKESKNIVHSIIEKAKNLGGESVVEDIVSLSQHSMIRASIILGYLNDEYYGIPEKMEIVDGEIVVVYETEDDKPIHPWDVENEAIY